MPYKMKGFPMIKGTGAMKAMKESAMKAMKEGAMKAMSPNKAMSPKKAMKDPMKAMKDPMKAMKAPLKRMEGAMKAMDGAMKVMDESPKKAMSPNKKAKLSPADEKRFDNLLGTLNKMADPINSNRGKSIVKELKRIKPDFDPEDYSVGQTTNEPFSAAEFKKSKKKK